MLTKQRQKDLSLSTSCSRLLVTAFSEGKSHHHCNVRISSFFCIFKAEQIADVTEAQI